MLLERVTIESPLGPLRAALRGRALCALDFQDRWPRVEAALRRRFGEISWRDGAPPQWLARCLGAYFAGRLDALDDLATDAGGTGFQRAVWAALRRVPPGTTTTYGALARALGRPGAARAVGAANAHNPVAIVVPCHRVIGAAGTLCGYAGGVGRKQWLLTHEAGALRISARA